MESDKNYKDLINEGFEVKSYAMNTIETANGLYILLFVTVLQKEKELYECQEYQTIDKTIETIDMTLICIVILTLPNQQSSAIAQYLPHALRRVTTE